MKTSIDSSTGERLTLKKKYADTLAALCPDLPTDEILTVFPYQLDRNVASKRVDGFCVFTRETGYIYENGALLFQFPMSEVERFRVSPQVGCFFFEYKMQNGEFRFVCRGDNHLRAEAGNAAKLLNRVVEYGETDVPDAAVPENATCCPKCGTPYSPGTFSCSKCKTGGNSVIRLIHFAKPYRLYLILSVFFFVLVTAVNLLVPYLNRELVDGYIRYDGGEAPSQGFWIGFGVLVASLFIAQIFQRLFSMIRGHFLIRAGNGMIVSLRSKVFEKIQQMSISRISKRTAGELMNRVNQDSTELRNFITDLLPSLLEQVLLFVAVFAILLWTDVGLTFLILLPTILVVFAFRLFWRFMNRFFRKSWHLSANLSTVLHDIFSGIRVVKAFGMEKQESARFDHASREESRNSYRLEKFWAFLNPFLNFILGTGEFILLYYVGSRVLNETMTLGEMAQFSAYAGMIYGPLQMFSTLPRRLMRTATSANKIFEVLDEKTELTDAENACSPEIQGLIELQNVSFGYDESREVLRNVNLRIEPGDFIGIVGKSGVGKSTLINLIMRMYDPESGRILIDGVDLRDISQDALRSRIGVVLQETFLFSGTVYENITYAKPDARPEEVIAAAKAAGAHSFIMKMKDGYETKIGEHGYTLSGGERQRIAIARALLHDPRILILDEATASLDTETEKQIQEALQRLSANRTTIAIAHRLSTLRNATRLVVLNEGSVAEVGTHEELMKKQGIYYGLVMAQRDLSRMTS